MKKNTLDVENANVQLLKHRARSIEFWNYPPPRTTLAAGLFLLGGIVFSVAGLSVFLGPTGTNERGLPMIILGGISK